MQEEQEFSFKENTSILGKCMCVRMYVSFCHHYEMLTYCIIYDVSKHGCTDMLFSAGFIFTIVIKVSVVKIKKVSNNSSVIRYPCCCRVYSQLSVLDNH